MGSKISKAVHVDEAAPSRPEIEPAMSLVVDVPSLHDNPPAIDEPPDHEQPANPPGVVGSPTDARMEDIENVPPPPQTALLPPPLPQPAAPQDTCVICCEPGLLSPCKSCPSMYCGICIKAMFLAACKDVSRMPPRCCAQIPLHYARPYLTQAEAAEFREKYEEWSAPQPFYCPVPTCSTFIPSRLLLQSTSSEKGRQRVDSAMGTPTLPEIACPKCNTDICTQCRHLAHPSSMCDNFAFGVDEETAKLLKSWGYKRCPKCGHGVRRMYGCNHMACICGAHWCWGCQQSHGECTLDCYDDDDDDDDDEEQDDIQPTGSNDANPPATTGDSATQPTETPTTAPQLIPPPRNLDAHSEIYWQQQGFDFGPEPAIGNEDRSWFCRHRFQTAKVSLADWLRNATATTVMDCVRCWNVVHAEVILPDSVNEGGTRVVAGRVHRHGPIGRGRGRDGEGRMSFPRELLRGGAIVRSASAPSLAATFASLSQSYPSESMGGVEYTSAPTTEDANRNSVIDTYGRINTTTEHTLKPQRRASFDIPAFPDIHQSPSWGVSSSSAPSLHSQNQGGFDGAMDDVSSFSFAHECGRCGLVVCDTCKDDALVKRTP